MSNEVYETETLLQEYLLFHYGTAREILPWPFGPKEALDYPVRCVTECVDPAPLGPDSRALDIGCATGRSSFELARHCGEVIAIDYSGVFIGAGSRIAAEGRLPYRYRVEGERFAEAEARLPEGVDPNRVHFEQGDAMALRDDLGVFDVVLAANLICRLAEPRKFLRRLPELVKPGGQLVINTPFTWMTDYTPADNWIGAHPESGESLKALKAELTDDFAVTGTANMPFLIREHSRKYQWSVAQSVRWVRKR
ncbi:MAG: putative 4-mercaptohistidine N1-methyltransferase [Opitutales bacterium]